MFNEFVNDEGQGNKNTSFISTLDVLFCISLKPTNQACCKASFETKS
jgi:hypothetical protein